VALSPSSAPAPCGPYNAVLVAFGAGAPCHAGFRKPSHDPAGVLIFCWRSRSLAITNSSLLATVIRRLAPRSLSIRTESTLGKKVGAAGTGAAYAWDVGRQNHYVSRTLPATSGGRRLRTHANLRPATFLGALSSIPIIAVLLLHVETPPPVSPTLISALPHADAKASRPA